MSAISGKDRIVEWLYANPAGATRKQLCVWLGRTDGAIGHLVANGEAAGQLVRRHHGGARTVTIYHVAHAPAEEPKDMPTMTRIAGKAPSSRPDPNAEGEITDKTVVTVCPGFEDRRFEVKEFQPYFSKLKIGRYPENDSAIARAYGGT